MPEKKSIAVYNLTPKNKRTIGVLFNPLNHFMASALKGMQKVIGEKGYEIILYPDRKTDGVLASFSGTTATTAHVVMDNEGGAFLATEHLIGQGCKHIAIIIPDLDNMMYAQRYTGYRNALGKYQIPFSNDLLITAITDIDGTIDPADLILQMDPLPDGLFITNDLTAAHYLQSLQEKGMRVPRDIAIVGFNNEPISRLTSPSLTTIDYPGFEPGRTAATNLLHLSSRKKIRQHRTTTTIPPTLIIRQSSLKTTK